MNRIVCLMKLRIVLTILVFGAAGGLLVASNRLADGELLHTGMRITPTAAADRCSRSIPISPACRTSRPDRPSARH